MALFARHAARPKGWACDCHTVRAARGSARLFAYHSLAGLVPVNEGGLAEQAVGQCLRASLQHFASVTGHVQPPLRSWPPGLATINLSASVPEIFQHGIGPAVHMELLIDLLGVAACRLPGECHLPRGLLQ